MAAPMWRVPEEERSRATTLDEEPERPTPVSVQACALAIAMHSAVVRVCGPAWVAALVLEQAAVKVLRHRAVAMQVAQPEGREPMVQ